MVRGQRVWWGQEQVTVVFANVVNDSWPVPFAKIMRNHGTGGVGFMCVDMSELSETEPEPEPQEPANWDDVQWDLGAISTIERVKTRRGHILIERFDDDGSCDYCVYDNAGKFLTLGHEPTRNYAITAAYIALCRADAIPF